MPSAKISQAQARKDKKALDKIAKVLRRPTWPGGADFLDWTNHIVQETGRSTETIRKEKA